MTKKSKQKLKYLEKENSFLFTIFKGLSLKQTRQIFLEGEGLTLMNCISSDDKWKKLTKEKNMN